MRLKISLFLLPLAVCLLSASVARSQEGQQSPAPSTPARSTPAATQAQPTKTRLKPPFFEEGRGFDVGFSESFLSDALFGVPDPGAGGGTGTDINPVLRNSDVMRNPETPSRSFGIFDKLPSPETPSRPMGIFDKLP